MEETGNLGDPARDLLQTEDRNDKEEDRNDKEEDKNDRDDSAKQEEGDDMEKDVSVEQRTQHFLDKEFASR
jgi:hypothetical protein